MREFPGSIQASPARENELSQRARVNWLIKRGHGVTCDRVRSISSVRSLDDRSGRRRTTYTYRRYNREKDDSTSEFNESRSKCNPDRK